MPPSSSLQERKTMFTVPRFRSCHLLPLLLSISGSSGVFATPAPAVAPPYGWPADAVLPVTLERIATLPEAEQPAWRAYLAASEERARALPPVTVHGGDALGPMSTPPKGARHTRGLRPEGAPAEWYATEEARVIADRVVEWQSPAGAWTKGIDYTRPRLKDGEVVDLWSRGTFDNNATTAEMRFLIRVSAASDLERARPWRAAFLRALDYVFAAQYPNGGFPQIYPLAGSYHDAITYNDSAMTHALEVLRDVAERKAGYELVPESQRAEAARRLQRGLECILATQIKGQDGRGTVWCQQHDALTLRPSAARNFEPIAASALEGAAICELLMTLPDPTPALARAIDDAGAWFARVALHDVTWERTTVEGSGLIQTPGASPLWSRLYQIGTDKPIFGDRDRTVHYAVTELSSERRLGYGWYGDWPQAVISARKHESHQTTGGLSR
jgi:PelA/Pel-15E family pectate lyase